MSKLDLISPEVKQRMEVVLKRYPEDKARSAVVEMLLQLQKQNGGYLTEDLMHAAAEYLNLPPIQVYEIATFYDMYELNVIGKHKIAVCTNVSCMLAGSDAILKRFEERLDIKPGETSKDGQFSLRAVECLAACSDAPVCQVDDQAYVNKLTPEKVDELIDSLQGDKA
jgi:NADH-quinone oxidoreductase, E subunit